MSTPREWFISVNTDAPDCLSDTAARSMEALKLGRYPTDEVVHVIEKTPEVVRKLECFDELVQTVSDLSITLAKHLVPHEKEICEKLLKKAKGE